jgi:hypothetical protein
LFESTGKKAKKVKHGGTKQPDTQNNENREHPEVPGSGSIISFGPVKVWSTRNIFLFEAVVDLTSKYRVVEPSVKKKPHAKKI